MVTIENYYRYAALATAAYVRMGGGPLDGATFATQAANPNQSGGRLPLSIASELFNPEDANAPRWTILNYYGGDIPESVSPIAAADKSGFAATLFQLSITGRTRASPCLF